MCPGFADPGLADAVKRVGSPGADSLSLAALCNEGVTGLDYKQPWKDDGKPLPPPPHHTPTTTPHHTTTQHTTHTPPRKLAHNLCFGVPCL